MNFITSVDPYKFNNMQYSIIGTGGFTRSLIEGLLELNITLPEVVFATSKDCVDDIYGVIVILLSETDNRYLNNIVLGSDVHQISLKMQVLSVVKERNIKVPHFYDVADFVVSRQAGIPVRKLSKEPGYKPYIMMIAVSHSSCSEKWLNNFFLFLEKSGIDIVVCHPLNDVDDSVFINAEFVFAWGGATEIFEQIKRQLNKLAVNLTYTECGFFPQREHFYFDKSGVNAVSQLMESPLTWVGEKEISHLKTIREAVFGKRKNTNQGWIFVPLQIDSDSNIQLYSKFNNGMQEYIDFICTQYPNQNIVFKAHPKDIYKAKYHCQYGHFSTEDTLDLIAGAKFVRGINSSVLFEAALFGKKIVTDGHSLLNHRCGNTDMVLAAMIARQFSKKETNFSLDKLKKFSHFDLKIMECGMNNKIRIINNSSGLVNVKDKEGKVVIVKPWEIDFIYSSLASITSVNELQMQTAMEADSSLISYFKSLKIGGELYITVPDFNYLAKMLMNADWTESNLRNEGSQLRLARTGIFGSQEKGNPLMDNYDPKYSDSYRSGYNEKSLAFLLNRVGFIDVNVSLSKEGELYGYGKKSMQRGERQISQSLDNIRKDHLNRYIFAADFLKEKSPKRVLDLACGIGYGTSILNDVLSTEVIGVDIDKGAIEYANEYYSRANIEFVCEDAQKLNLPADSFDAIVSFETIEHVPFDQLLISSFYNLLKPQGHFICSTPNEDIMPFDENKFPFHIKHYTNLELKIMLTQAGFKNIKIFTQKDPINGQVVPGQDGFFTIAVAIK